MQFAREHCGSKREFYDQTGISRGTIESKTGITEDTLVKFFATYKNVNPLYIITGEGSLFKEKSKAPDLPGCDRVAEERSEYSPGGNDNTLLKEIIREKDHRIEELCEKIGGLQNEVHRLKKDNKTSCHPNHSK